MSFDRDLTIQSVWKPDLYRMQLEAPTPKPIVCPSFIFEKPYYLHDEYHGLISHLIAEQLLNLQPEGSYLVRESAISKGEFHTLSLKFNGKVHHYKLFYDPTSGFYVREKRYDNVKSLVADGLVTMYLELKAPLLIQRLDSSVSYHESPYMTLNKRKLKVLTRQSNNRSSNRNGLKKTPTSTTKNIFPSSKKDDTGPLIINSPTGNPIFSFGNENSSLASTPTTNDLLLPFEKPHAFRVHTFKGLNWCEFCGNFLWGFSQQGVKCEDCGFVSHVKCSHSVPADCVPDLKKVRGVFGIDLTNVLVSRKATLPFVIVKCIAEIEARGLTCEGIYRLSGFADEVDALKMALDTDGENANLSESAYSNINVVAGALKLYLRLLPVPLITFLAHPALIKAIQRKSLAEQIVGIREGLNLLPVTHYHTLQYVLEHLHRVSLHQAINKMTAHNLATVFAPTLIGPPTAIGPLSVPPDITSDILLIEIMITYCMKIFQ